VSSKTATTAVPMSVGGCVITTPLLRPCHDSTRMRLFGPDQYALRRDDQGMTRWARVRSAGPGGLVGIREHPGDEGRRGLLPVRSGHRQPAGGEDLLRGGAGLAAHRQRHRQLEEREVSPGQARRPVSARHSHMACAGRASQGRERLKINRVVHIMATVQLRNPTERRAYTTAARVRGRPRWRPCAP
jgi:hypothetical protein